MLAHRSIRHGPLSLRLFDAHLDSMRTCIRAAPVGYEAGTRSSVGKPICGIVRSVSSHGLGLCALSRQRVNAFTKKKPQPDMVAAAQFHLTGCVDNYISFTPSTNAFSLRLREG